MNILELLKTVPVEVRFVVRRRVSSANRLHQSGYALGLEVVGPLGRIVLVHLEEVVDVAEVHGGGHIAHSCLDINASGHGEHASAHLRVILLGGRKASVSPDQSVMEKVVVVCGVQPTVAQVRDGVRRVAHGRVHGVAQRLGVRSKMPHTFKSKRMSIRPKATKFNI